MKFTLGLTLCLCFLTTSGCESTDAGTTAQPVSTMTSIATNTDVATDQTDDESTTPTNTEGMRSETVIDPDDGEPMAYVYPSTLDAATAQPQLPEECSETKLGRIRGWAVDRIGRPITGAQAQACGTTDTGMPFCLQPSEPSGADGVYVVQVPTSTACLQKAVLRVTQIGVQRAAMYCEVDLNSVPDTGEIILRDPSVLYATLGSNDKPAYEPSEMARDVRFSSGVTMNVVPYDLFGGEPESDYDILGVRHVLPSERGLCFLDEDNRPDHLFAFSPDVNVLEGGVGIRIENTYGYTPNQELEVWLLGGVDCTIGEQHIEEGKFVQVGSATVNTAGDVIETNFGLSCLTWMGIRAGL